MSLLKWTLALAGTAMGMRYMSDRHRRRMGGGGELAEQTDRDDGRMADTPWSTAQSGSEAVGGTGTGTSLGSGLGSTSGVGSSSTGASTFDQDDLLSPDSDRTPGGGSSNRF